MNAISWKVSDLRMLEGPFLPFVKISLVASESSGRPGLTEDVWDLGC